MKVNFVTSGFPNGFTEMFLAELRRYLPAQGFFVMVASDFSAHEKSQQYLQQYIRDFSVYGISFQEAALVDFTISQKEAVSLVQRADVIWLSGGPTLTQIRHIKEYRLIEPLREQDGVTIGMSAESINMARQVVVAKDLDDGIVRLSQYEGIGLVDFNIEPHFASVTEERMPDIREAAKKADAFYGLYDESFLVEKGGSIQFFGPYCRLCELV